MSLSRDHRAKLLAETRDAAAALIEDIQHIRALLAQKHVSGAEIRRLSAVLRRLLVEGDLPSVAAPRIGKVKLSAPNNDPLYRANETIPYTFCVSAGAPMFGIIPRACTVTPGRPVALSGAELDQMVELRTDTFLTQRVLCLHGRWVSRGAVIKYIANFASGVHSGSPSDDDGRAIRQMRRAMSLGRKARTNHYFVLVHPKGLTEHEGELLLDPDKIDPALMEVLAAAHFVVDSPAVQELEKAIRDELFPPPHPPS